MNNRPHKQHNPAKRIIIAQLGLLLVCLGNASVAQADNKDMVWIPAGEFSMGSENPLKEIAGAKAGAAAKSASKNE
ncbi:hypothetical protein KA344_12510, partial [bacterium]|nr:hypothetical protein [bacterium]